MKPVPGSAALRRGRSSAPGAEYLITFRSKAACQPLTNPRTFRRMLEVLAAADEDDVLEARAFVLMPDHLHLLMILGDKLPLAKAVARLKFQVRRENLEIKWQEGFYDHRMRVQENRAPVFHYIFLNPYRKNLCGRDERWPYFWCCPADWEWFSSNLDVSCPRPEWLE